MLQNNKHTDLNQIIPNMGNGIAKCLDSDLSENEIIERIDDDLTSGLYKTVLVESQKTQICLKI